jgi:hypothetical protein
MIPSQSTSRSPATRSRNGQALVLPAVAAMQPTTGSPARRIPTPPPMPWTLPDGALSTGAETTRRTPAPLRANGMSVSALTIPADAYVFNTLLCGMERGVLDRIVSCECVQDGAGGVSASQPARFELYEVQAMTTGWDVACSTGGALIGGNDRHARVCAVTIQHFVEAWLAERLRGPTPFYVVAAIHTPLPATPLRQESGAAVSDGLMAPHQSGDAGVQATISSRAGSIRDLLDAGAVVHACYSQQGFDSLAEGERQTYQDTRRAYPNLIDAPRRLSRDTFAPHCGATYLFGEDPLALTGCFAIRLPQAADAPQGPAEARLIVTSSIERVFDECLGALSLNLHLLLDSGPLSFQSLGLEYERA